MGVRHFGRTPANEANPVKQPSLVPGILAGLLAALHSAPLSAQDKTAANLQWQGVATCTASGCHSGFGPRGSKGNEYTTWINHDPHARAYAVLFDESSRVIEKNLHRLKTTKEAKPEKDALCLSCHAPEPAAHQKGERFSLQDGVGCENCHGAAERWLTEHYQAGWRGLSQADKAQRGFRNTKDLVSRARACVACHVGEPGREVNHDLIAAGHPRLNFELSAFHANLAKHWTEQGDNARPDFDARLWLIGQIVSTEAAVALLADRANGAREGKRPWPEFAEYDCFACHHGLRDEDWRRRASASGRRPGSYPWATWYSAAFPLLEKQWPEAAKVGQELRQLDQLLSTTAPDAAKVAVLAETTRADLNQWADKVQSQPIPPEAINQLFQAFAAQHKGLTGAGWDAAAQTYLGLAALHQSRRGNLPPGQARSYEEKLRSVMEALKYPVGFNSPRGYGPSEFQKRLGELQKLTGN